MNINKLLAALAVAMLFFFTSCDDKDKDTTNPLTPTDSQAKLENIGIALANEINVADFQEVVDLMNDFGEIAESLQEDVFQTESTVNSLKKVVSKNDLKALAGMMKTSAMAVPEDYYNTYYRTMTYDETTGEWVESANANALELRFKSGGKDAVISGTISDDYYTVTVDGTDVYVPKTATTSIKLGGVELLKFIVSVPALSSSSNKVSATLTHAKSNITWTADVDVTTNSSLMSAAVKKGTKTLISAKITTDVNGFLVNDGDEINDIVLDIVMPGKTVYEMNVMDELFIRAECSDVEDFVQAMNELDEDNNLSREAYCEAQKNLFNQYLKIYFSYVANMSVKEGDLYYDYTITEVDGETSVEMVFGIQFADGSKHKLEDFFTKDSFANFIDAMEQLATDFQNLVE